MARSSNEQQNTTYTSTASSNEPLFDTDLDKKYVCPVCLCVMKEPKQTSCGHRFCSACIMGTMSLEVRNDTEVPYSKCPVDNTYFHIEKGLFRDNAIKREILSLNVRCPNEEVDKCDWSGELRDYNKHDEQCKYKVVECDNGCRARVMRQDMPNHLEHCSHRIVSCPYCSRKLTYNVMSKHEVLVCQNFPVQCLQCGQVGIKRKNISKHIDKENGDCPITIIDCPFRAYGCRVTTSRLCMASHLQDSCHIHLSYVMAHVQIQDRHIAELVHEVTTIRQALNQKDTPSVDDLLRTGED